MQPHFEGTVNDEWNFLIKVAASFVTSYYWSSAEAHCTLQNKAITADIQCP